MNAISTLVDGASVMLPGLPCDFGVEVAEDALEDVEDGLELGEEALGDLGVSTGVYGTCSGLASHTPSLYVGSGVVIGPGLAGRKCCPTENEPTLAIDIIMSSISIFVKCQCC